MRYVPNTDLHLLIYLILTKNEVSIVITLIFLDEFKAQVV